MNNYMRLEMKQAPTDDGQFDGFASVMDIVDLQGDVIDEGAFSRTLKHKGGKVPLLQDHNPSGPDRIGIAEVKENGKRIDLKGHLNLEKQSARDTLSDLRFNHKHGITTGLSIGFEIVKQKVVDGVRHIKELALWEVSVVTFPANPQAVVTGVKSVVPFQDLPLAESGVEWDSAAARGRVRAWAVAEEGPTEKYREAFLWVDDEAAENFGAYKLPIADVIDGRLTAIPRGIFAAAGVVMGARGGVNIPDEDMPRIKAHLAKYYRKMDLSPPWEQDSSFAFFLSQIASVGDDYVLDESEQSAAVEAKSRLEALLSRGVDNSASGHLSSDDGLGEGSGDVLCLLVSSRASFSGV